MDMIRKDGWWIPDIAPGGKSGMQPDRNLYIITMALTYVKRRTLVLQAGAFFGQWPVALSPLFESVVAIEGDEINHECCKLNLQERGVTNVTLHHNILGSVEGQGSMVQHTLLAGAHHADYSGGSTPVCTIDSFGLLPDLIMLDVEGAEVPALQGAAGTLGRCSPVIVLEDNEAGRSNFGLRPGHQQKFMATIGYTPFVRHNKDYVYVREKSWGSGTR